MHRLASNMQRRSLLPENLNNSAKSPLKKTSFLLKRLFDITIAVPLLLLSLPLLIITSIMIFCISPGSPLFCQKRQGQNGSVFRLWKLRTMHHQADKILKHHFKNDPRAYMEWKLFLRLKKDPRLLPIIGRFLRHCSIDELPQLWNIICGEMSLVGPRPFAINHLEAIQMRYSKVRNHMKPGLTGLWQVSGRGDTNIRKMIVLDVIYAKKWSFCLDLWILLNTIPIVITGRGAY